MTQTAEPPERLTPDRSTVTMNRRGLLHGELEQLERQLISALYAVWKAMGKEKRIVSQK